MTKKNAAISETSEKEVFILAIDEATEILGKELEAIRKGDVTAVIALTDDKRIVTERLEQLSGEIEAFLKKHEDGDVVARVRTLRAAIEENQEALDRMSAAVKEVANQLRRLEDKRRDNGLYGRKGKKLRALREQVREVDGSF